MNELQALQNAANNRGITIKEYHFEDKRKKIKNYIAVNSRGISVSPPLSYEYLNMFLLGWAKGIDSNKQSN